MARPEVQGLTGGRKAMYLRHNQPEIVDYWWKEGTSETLTEFHIRKTDTLERLLKVGGVTLWVGWQYYPGKEPSIRCSTGKVYGYSVDLLSMETPVNLTGQAKHKWLELHKADVIRFHEAHGPTATILEYDMRPSYLAEFLRKAYQSMGLPMPEPDLRGQVEKLADWVVLLSSAVAELRGEVRGLSESYGDFVARVTEGLQQLIGRALGQLFMPSANQQPGQEAPLSAPKRSQLAGPSLSIEGLYQALKDGADPFLERVFDETRALIQ